MSTVDPNTRVDMTIEKTNRPAFSFSKIFNDSVPLASVLTGGFAAFRFPDLLSGLTELMARVG